MSSPRQVALMLHGLADADRAWLLGRLGPAQVGVLEPLLAELRELGIPADPALAAQALEPVAARPDAQLRGITQTIAAGSLPQLQLALADEPRGMIAAVLMAGPWPWQEEFLAAQEPAKARAIRDLMRSHPGGPALHRAVLSALAQRLAEMPVEPRAPAPRWPRFARQLGNVASRLAPRGRA